MTTRFPDGYLPVLPEVAHFLDAPHPLVYGGRQVAPLAGRSFVSHDPSTGQELARVGRAGPEDVDAAVAAARHAFETGPWWRTMSPSERSRCLWRLAELIERDAEPLAQLEALDNGKPVATARSVDVPLAAEHLRYYAGWCSKIEGSTLPLNTPGMFAYTLREPVGVVGLIVPWNYPLLMAVWKLAPALAAGNCVLLKPAEQTPLSALWLVRLADEAGFPPGVFNVLSGFGEEAGAALVAHPGVDKIGFTGSVEVARQIVRASAADLKRVSLELGGKSPNIVFADADLEQAALGATWAIFGNNGQSCTAGSRLYLERSVYDAVLERMVATTAAIRVGPGMGREAPDLGPVVSETQLERVLGYVEEGLTEGAEAIVGGARRGDAGYFVEPTILTGTHDGMRLVREEIFGPVVAAMPFDEVDEVLARANDSPYGLAAGVWTRDLNRAHRLARELKAGTVWINTWGDTEAGVPFGGFKQSGYGREMGKEAIELYSEVKSVWIEHG